MSCQQIYKEVKSYHPNANVTRCKGWFEKIIKDNTVCSWVSKKPLFFNGFAIVWLECSPSEKDNKVNVFYDYISEEKYREKFE